jgi:D-tyrosyl-tRNA(Tyr) deacylase
MRAVIQRVSAANVISGGKNVAGIENGLVILLGIEEADNESDIEWLTKKIVQLRIFSDENGLMNFSILDVGGNAIVVSQFTLHASVKKGNRPSYIRAARPETAIPLYEKFVATLEKLMERPVGTGIFGAHMEVSLVNDGPVTIVIDTKNREF